MRSKVALVVTICTLSILSGVSLLGWGAYVAAAIARHGDLIRAVAEFTAYMCVAVFVGSGGLWLGSQISDNKPRELQQK